MPSVLLWLGNHAFDLFSSVGIISSLIFTAIALHRDAGAQQLDNFLKLTEQHRDIWKETQSNPKLTRIRDAKADIKAKPVTGDETQFVMLLIFHLHCWFRASQNNQVFDIEGIEYDIRSFFGRPVPKQVWDDRKTFFDRDFRRFVDDLLC